MGTQWRRPQSLRHVYCGGNTKTKTRKGKPAKIHLESKEAGEGGEGCRLCVVGAGLRMEHVVSSMSNEKKESLYEPGGYELQAGTSLWLHMCKGSMR